MRTCTVGTCEKQHVARGMCRTHYGLWYEKQHPRNQAVREAWRKEYAIRNRDKILAWKRKSTRAYRERNPDAWRNNALPRLFGITPTDYDVLLAAQNGVCAICGHPQRNGTRLDVDHVHGRRGVVRGLLCRSCNMGLGYFADSPERLEAAATYLRSQQ